MESISQILLDKYNAFADKAVGWELDKLQELLSWIFKNMFLNMDLLLPMSGLISLFMFRPTRWFAIGSLILGFFLI